MLNQSLYVILQYFDNVGWVFWPVKIVAHLTYTVLVELNHALSIYLGSIIISPPRFLAVCGMRRLKQASFVLLYFVLFAFSGLCLVFVVSVF